jgi:maleylpyruvate isomerase
VKGCILTSTVEVMDPRELDMCVTGCAHAHQRLLADLDCRVDIGDIDPGAPSLLPDWTVGHVLGHIAGNAEAFTRVMQAAVQGDRGAMYPNGRQGRRQRIEELAATEPHELVSTVRRSIWALESAWASCTSSGWHSDARGLGGTFPVAQVPLRRWREVEVHRSDLGWGYLPADWDVDFVARDLPVFSAQWLASNAAVELPAQARELGAGDRLGWLLGRVRHPGLPEGLTL